MKYKCADEKRDAGIRLLYDAILRKHLRDNQSYKESKEIALDAVQNRYTLSRKRIKAIVNQLAKADLQGILPSLRFQEESLVDDLREENAFLASKIEQNNRLINVISDVIHDYKRRG